jgi:hypothetical protein
VRRLTHEDLPQILRAIRAPAHVRRALGDFTPLPDYFNQLTGPMPGGTNPGEELVFGCSPDELQQMSAYDQSGGSLGVLQNSPADAPGFDDIVWSASAYTNQDCYLTADRKRVVLIVENIGSTNAVVVNFGTAASSSTFATNGLVLFSQGSVLYIDRFCPTNDIYVHGVGASANEFSVVVGTRGQPQQPLPPSLIPGLY